MWFPTKQTQINKSMKHVRPFLAEKESQGLAWVLLARTAQSAPGFPSGAALPWRALGSCRFKVRPAVGTVNSESEFQSLPCHTACRPSQQMAETLIYTAPDYSGREPTATLGQYSPRPGFTLNLLYI